jgi:hypothetical protein
VFGKQQRKQFAVLPTCSVFSWVFLWQWTMFLYTLQILRLYSHCLKSMYVLRAWCKEMYNVGIMNNCTRLCAVNYSLYWRVFSSTWYLRLDELSVSYRIISVNKMLIIRPNTTYRFSTISFCYTLRHVSAVQFSQHQVGVGITKISDICLLMADLGDRNMSQCIIED